ncbi:CNNM domain-containing protein [Paenibacillus naphthalenovorans]|uniref:CNNM domain-containing protein n=1 Tax=Paenibacillus naphthalenovorans TaxID=162209 RepID=UPI000A5F6124
MEIIILIILVALNAFFAASEIALISLNDNKVKLMAEEGNKKANLLYQLLKEPSRFLAMIQIGITLAGFLASAFAADSFAGSLARFIYEMGVPISQNLLEKISVIFITLVLSYFTLVFGELVPKRLAMKKAEAISMIVVRPLTALSVIASPFVKLLTASTNVMFVYSAWIPMPMTSR